MLEFLNRRKWIIIAGTTFGILGALLVNWGNPGNMGVCVACFYRDIAGALNLHQAEVVQYLRPEIFGFLFGAMISAFAFGEWRPRGGSSPLIRFFLAAFAMIGALVFLGCPVRMLLRLAGGDLNAVTAIAGLLAGIGVGVFFLKRGFTLGRATKVHPLQGLMIPVLFLGLLVFVIIEITMGTDVITTSESGPGSMFAPLAVSLIIGMVIGFLFQRSRMCTVGGWRDLILIRDTHLFTGIFLVIVVSLITNYIVGNFAEGTLVGKDIVYQWGFADQPVSHNDHLWNFLGMALAGMAFVMGGACPLRQTVLAGEGDADAGIWILGLIAGAAVAHNFSIASTPAGHAVWGPAAVIIGLVFCVIIGFIMQSKA